LATSQRALPTRRAVVFSDMVSPKFGFITGEEKFANQK
jgi:hypothetical protein